MKIVRTKLQSFIVMLIVPAAFIAVTAVTPFHKSVSATETAVSNPDAFADFALLGDSISTKSETALPKTLAPSAPPLASAADSSDKKAAVYDIKGTVKIARQGTSAWESAKKGAGIREGDILLTEAASHASVTFDNQYSNVTHIPANTRAVFRSIEPTEIFLEDGTLYNIFDGLQPNESWKVTTPTAVAAVRGTWWLVGFENGTGNYSSAVIKVSDDNTESFLEVLDILKNGQTGVSIELPEGFKIELLKDQVPDPSLVTEFNPSSLVDIWDFFELLAKLRAARGRQLPPTGGEFDVPPTDPASLGLFNNVPPVLDPIQDIGNPSGVPVEDSFSSSLEVEPEPEPESQEECSECNFDDE